MDGTWPIIETLYDILYVDLDAVDEDDGGLNDDGLIKKEKEPKEGILGDDYLEIGRLREGADRELTAPQWIQCFECKKWRVIPVEMSKVVGGEWAKSQRFETEWRCNVEDGLDRDCDSEQNAPSKRSHSEHEVAILRLQRKWMNARYSKQETLGIEDEMKAVLKALKVETVHKLVGIGDDEMAEARFLGIGEWSGFNEDGDGQNDDEMKMCRFHQHLVSSLRFWRIESLKTLMDHFGFFVEQKTKEKRSGNYKVAQIAMSYPKETVIAKLAAFLMFPCKKALHLKTDHFKK